MRESIGSQSGRVGRGEDDARNSLVAGRQQLQVQASHLLLPLSVGIGSTDFEGVLPGWQVRVEGLATFTDIIPVSVKGHESVAKANLVPREEIRHRVVDLKVFCQGRQVSLRKNGVRFVVGDNGSN